MPIKSNHKVALSPVDKQRGRWVQVDTLVLEPNTVGEVYLEGVDFPIMLVKQVFVNGEGSTGVRYLVSSDRTLTYERITTLYRTRVHDGTWNPITSR